VLLASNQVEFPLETTVAVFSVCFGSISTELLWFSASQKGNLLSQCCFPLKSTQNSLSHCYEPKFTTETLPVSKRLSNDTEEIAIEPKGYNGNCLCRNSPSVTPDQVPLRIPVLGHVGNCVLPVSARARHVKLE